MADGGSGFKVVRGRNSCTSLLERYEAAKTKRTRVSVLGKALEKECDWSEPLRGVVERLTRPATKREAVESLFRPGGTIMPGEPVPVGRRRADPMPSPLTRAAARCDPPAEPLAQLPPDWPPRPQHFKNKYTKAELVNVARSFRELPPLEQVERQARAQDACFREKLGSDRYFSLFRPHLDDGTRSPLKHAEQLRLHAWDTFQMARQYPRDYGHAQAPDSPAFAREVYDRRFASSVEDVRKHMRDLADLALYDPNVDPQQKVERLREKEGVYSYASNMLPVVLKEVHGLDVARFRSEEDQGVPSDYTIRKDPAFNVHDALRRQREREQQERARDTQSNLEYLAGARALDRFFTERHERGLKWNSGAISRALSSEAKLEMRRMGWNRRGEYEANIRVPQAPGWIFIGPRAQTSEGALAGLAAYVRAVAQAPREAASKERGLPYQVTSAAQALAKKVAARVDAGEDVRLGAVE